VSANFNVIHEKQTLDASFASGSSASNSNHLNTVSLDVTYAYQQTWAASAGLFIPAAVPTWACTRRGRWGAASRLAGQPRVHPYARVRAISASSSHSHGRGSTCASVCSTPAIPRFNGGDTNYDGFGRSASDNNTLFGFFWFAL